MSIETYQDICSELSSNSEALILFETDYETVDNTETMDVFLEIFDIPEDDILLYDGTYVEVLFNGLSHEVHASGNGDFSSHKIEIKPISK